jgi:5'-nucleotidase
VIHTSDVHGHYSSDAERQGGLLQLAALVDEARNAGPVLLLDGGDMWSGTMLSDSNEGRLGVRLYSLLGYDAAALGNHELDYGPAGPGVEGGDPFSALVARLQEVSFPVLSANLRDRKTGAYPAWLGTRPSLLVERGGFKIGLIGITTPGTPKITFPYVGERLDFLAPAPVVAEEAVRLRAQGAELVFVVAHLGGACAQMGDPFDTATCDPRAEVVELVQALPPGGVDAVFAGHTHQVMGHWFQGVAVLQPGQYGKSASLLEIATTPQGRPRLTIRPLVALQGRSPSSPLAERIAGPLEEAERSVEARRMERLGARVMRPLVRSSKQSSPLGSLVCDALLALHPDREVCIVNSGGLRQNLPAGELTYGALYDALPFDNRVATLDLPGSTLVELLRIGTSGAHGVIQVGGLELEYDQGKDPCPTADRDGDGRLDVHDRDRLTRATLADGRPIDPGATYRLVTHSFLARGGDGWGPVIARLHPNRIQLPDSGLPLRDEVAAWLRRTRPLLNSVDRPVMPTLRVHALGEEPKAACP